jgi:hypothetical protein
MAKHSDGNPQAFWSKIVRRYPEILVKVFWVAIGVRPQPLGGLLLFHLPGIPIFSKGDFLQPLPQTSFLTVKTLILLPPNSGEDLRHRS